MNLSPSAARTGFPAWLARSVVTVVCSVAAFVVGVVFGLGGLMWAVALLAAGVLAVSVLAWRRAALPLAALIVAMSLGSLLSTRSDARVALSLGSRDVVVGPGELPPERSYRRGFGSLSVDLRDAGLRPGTTTNLHLRSDVGSVVVALDRGVCTQVNLRWRQLETNPAADELVTWAVAAGLPELDAVPSSQNFLPDLFSASHPDALRTRTGKLSSGFVTPIAGRYGGGPAQWFGQTPSRIVTPAVNGSIGEDELGGRHEYRLTRRVVGRRVAVLNLDIQAASGFVVRDYPRGVNVRTTDRFAAGQGWPQEAQSRSYMPPDEPTITYGDVERSPAARRRWADWERAWVKAAQRRAVLAAGTCATAAALRDHWETAGYAADEAGVYAHALAVNGLGELVASSSRGERPAAGSAQALASMTGTRAIDAATQRQRLEQYRTANLPKPSPPAARQGDHS